MAISKKETTAATAPEDAAKPVTDTAPAKKAKAKKKLSELDAKPTATAAKKAVAKKAVAKKAAGKTDQLEVDAKSAAAAKQAAAPKAPAKGASGEQQQLPLAGNKTPVGTKALAGAAKEIGEQKYAMIDPRFLVIPEGENPRIDYGDMTELEESIKHNGVIRPIRVQLNEHNNYKVLDGFRRATACYSLLKKGVKLKNVPVIVEPKTTPLKDVLRLKIIENQGKQFTPLEEAVAMQSMVDAGMSAADIAKATGRTQRRIKDKLSFLSASEKIRKALHEGKLTIRTAREIIKASKDHEEQDKLLKKAMDKGNASVHKELNEERSESDDKKVNASQARKLLAQVAAGYVEVVRSKGPFKPSNPAFAAFEKTLKQIRKQNRLGLYS